MFTWAQVTESILSNSFDHLMCHLCKNSWEISWVESHKHVTVETHKSYVWLVQSASCLTCSIHSHLANLCTQTTSLTSLQLPHFAKRPGADRTLWRAGSGPRAACLSLLSQQKHRQRSAFTLNVRMTYSGPRRHTRLVWSSSLWRTCDRLHWLTIIRIWEQTWTGCSRKLILRCC